MSSHKTHVELGRALHRSQLLEGENQRLKGDGAPDLIAALARSRQATGARWSWRTMGKGTARLHA